MIYASIDTTSFRDSLNGDRNKYLHMLTLQMAHDNHLANQNYIFVGGEMCINLGKRFEMSDDDGADVASNNFFSFN